MKVPNFIDSQVVGQDGRLTDTWKNIFTQLLDNLQATVSDEGINIPQQTTTDIATLATSKSVGKIIYDKTTNQYKACIPNGSVGQWKVITLA